MFESIWEIFTNNGMYSNTEAVVVLILSAIFAFLIMWRIRVVADQELKEDMIKDLGIEGCKQLKDRLKDT